MGEPQPIRFSVPEEGFDLTLLPEAARQRDSEAFRVAVTAYFKDAYREAGGRVDVGFSDGAIEVAWEPQADQLPARPAPPVRRQRKLVRRFASLTVTSHWCRDRIGHFLCLRPLSG